MVRTSALIALGAGAFLGLAGAAQAMPAAPVPPATDLVQPVAGGCGPGFFRGWDGFCRPGGPRVYGYGYGYGPRPYYGPRPFYGPRPYWGARPYYGPGRFYGPRW